MLHGPDGAASATGVGRDRARAPPCLVSEDRRDWLIELGTQKLLGGLSRGNIDMGDLRGFLLRDSTAGSQSAHDCCNF